MTLSKQFKKVVDSKEIERVLRKPGRLIGSAAFHDKRHAIARYINGGWGRLYEWHVKGSPSLLIMSEKHAKALLKHKDLPIKQASCPLQSSWESVREGQIVLALSCSKDSPIYLMRRENVEEALEAMKLQEKQDLSI